MVARTATYVNESRRTAESLQKVIEIRDRLEGAEVLLLVECSASNVSLQGINLVSSSRKYVLENDFVIRCGLQSPEKTRYLLVVLVLLAFKR